MGSAFSSWRSPAVEGALDDSSSILAFHNSSQWKTHFESIRGSNRLMVIDFTASWCGPCRFMEPVLKELATKYSDVVFVKIDVDELSDVSREWGVQAMPTFVLVKNGSELDRVIGAKKDELQKKIEKFRFQEESSGSKKERTDVV